MPMYNNDARNERTQHKEGGSKGEQGGKGSGKEKCCADGGKSSAPSFKPASEVIGAPIHGELDVPGLGIVKGAGAPGVEGVKKGENRPMRGGGPAKKSKDAQDAGR